MRSDKEILDLILQYAKDDDNIRVVEMNGSRVNPNIKSDLMQDFDVVYYARDVKPLWHNLEIPAYFGELAILQLPEEIDDPPPANDGTYAYLMQFKDGHRIDLGICPLENLEYLGGDSLTVILLDKDGLAPNIPPPSEDSYLPKPPTAKQFADCTNEFWWLTPYVAKALWRGELVNASFFLDNLMRGQLHKMLNWYFCVQVGFDRAPGKLGKRWKDEFSPEVWEMLEQTYADHRFPNIWRTLHTMGDLFRHTAQTVAVHFGYPYPQSDDDNVNVLIRRIQALPADAESFEDGTQA